MEQSTQATLLASYGGREWALEVDSEAVRSELAAWLGTWARAARGEEARSAAGFVTMVAADPTSEKPGVRRDGRKLELHSDECDILVAGTAETEHARVRYRAGCVRPAAYLALRILAARRALSRGWIALHAAAVRTSRGVILFAGPSGAGKTTAARAFPRRERLEDDLVLAAEEDGDWVRLDVFDPLEPGRYAPRCADGLAIRALLLPEPGGAFRFTPLNGAEAYRACLQALSLAGVGGYEADTAEVSQVLKGLDGLVAAVPVARFAWSISDDLPALLEASL